MPQILHQARCRRSFPHHFLHKIAAAGLLTAAALLVQLFAAPHLHAQSGDRPNIVLIFTDDQGWNDIGCYGSEIPTPNIDRLAAEGIKLTQFYAASSICTPSRFGLLTGRYPHRSHDQLLSALMFLAEPDQHRGLREHETTYVKLLKDAGYQTALVGKWHLGHGEKEFWPTEHGFDEFFGHTGGCVDFFTLHYGNQPDWYRGRQLVSIDGWDLRPILKSDADKTKDRELVWMTGSHAELDRGTWGAIRQGDWKWLQMPDSEPMLFHLRDDPNETTDLAATRPDRTKSMGADFREAVEGR